MRITAAWHASLTAEASALGLLPIAPEMTESLRSFALATLEQQSYADQFSRRCAERLVRSTPLFTMPGRCTTLGGKEEFAAVYFDPMEPDVAWFAPGFAVPALCWAELGPEFSSAKGTLAAYQTTERKQRFSFPKSMRFAKYLENTTLDAVLHGVAAAEPWIDDATWMGANNNDPFCGLGKRPSMFELSLAQRAAIESNQNELQAVNFSTLWSRSVLSVVSYPNDLFVFDLRYAPIANPRGIAHLQASLNLPLPRDLPMDAAASVVRGATVATFPDSIDQTNPWLLLAEFHVAPFEQTPAEKIRRALAEWRSGDERYEILLQMLHQSKLSEFLIEEAVMLPDGHDMLPDLRRIIIEDGEKR